MIKAEDVQELKVDNKPTLDRAMHVVAVALSVFVFLFSIQLMSGSLEVIGKDFAREILLATSNPFIGLFIGLLSTAILQSSSTTTSMVVAAVAVGSLSLQGAIPIVMGANLGTTITSTIVSLSFVNKSDKFAKAFSAGTAHDFFNILVIILIFPLEYYYGLLSKISTSVASAINVNSAEPLASKLIIYNFFEYVQEGIVSQVGAIITLIIAIVLLITVVKVISNLLYNQLIGDTRKQFKTVVFNNKLRSFGWGFLLTSIVQSSSLTTSLMVPLAATRKIHMQRAFQFILGANLGTTITAIIAALFKSDAAISLAVAHFMFNLIGVLLFLFIPFFAKLPTYFANLMGILAVRYRWTAFVYILVVFFMLPFALIYFSNRNETVDLSSNNAIEQIAQEIQSN